jgi:DNA-binding NarL/FixJ family response regulator
MEATIQPLSIIIADDHSLFRQGVTSALLTLPFVKNVAQVENGKEVIEHLETFPFNIVLMDIRMAPLNGIETTVMVHEKFPNTKVIGLSSHEDEYYILEMYSRGAAGYILKNTDISEIALALQTVASGKKYFPESLRKYFLKHRDLHIEHAFSNKHYVQERLREIIYLICMEKSSKEIASILSISYKTVELDRLKLNNVIGAHSVVGLIKYGMQINILEDKGLQNKFAKYFLPEKKTA